jgi:hypothetical protein
MDILQKMKVLAESDDDDAITMRTVRRWASLAVVEIEALRNERSAPEPNKKSPKDGEQEHRYAVAIEDGDQFGMCAGPFLEKAEAYLDFGHNEKSVILRLSPKDGDTIIARWCLKQNEWQDECAS